MVSLNSKSQGGLSTMMKLFIFVATLWLLLFLTNPVYAYLDPGTGSMMLQIVLGGVAGLVVIIRLFWHQLLALFGIGKDKKTDLNQSTTD
jgi:hypothetical protein